MYRVLVKSNMFLDDMGAEKSARVFCQIETAIKIIEIINRAMIAAVLV